ncbi:tRNA epoxyqueuosine(34) reductase QueG [Futiania mangrovi]|uniref:Epoxyqueuosine reductase n=1 Tax=Futiania mangrovi TaxID=2959716 RepID=A0A9J6PHA1_9PROT|nr:tRNA epoxyqueuosine(34) reductase QueG [Futiania mangrovii]MCP1337192.1 tRNA epoxyqueuosine(34) reductase QueG [Futiania mangrovii]
MTDAADIRREIEDRLRAEGFEAVAIARTDAAPQAGARLEAWLGEGFHGDMGWMDRPERRHPNALWPAARSVIVAAANYGPADDPLDLLQMRDRAAVSVYARGADYHDVLKARLKRVARWLAETHGADVKVLVDTAGIMEKPLAEAAGLGWQGKHTNLVSREHGSWLFLAEILTDLDLPPDTAETDHCGTCRACLDACPTKAFPAPYRLDARRCISYLTIEHKGHIPAEFRVAMGNRIYGCDDCLAVCPWNKFAHIASEAKFHARAELSRPRLADLANLDDAAFREVFSGSPIKRIGRDRFLRNVLIAIGNSGDPALSGVAERHLADPSALVRAMAVWAVSRLLDGDAFAGLRAAHLPSETDPDVAAEWDTAPA